MFVGRGRQTFDTDRATALAIERLLEIIGEAATALSDSTRQRFPTVDWRSITRLRVVLAHHYHRVDPDLVWTMADVDVAVLLSALEVDGSAG
jgi:uncharacterized protein with HEPN domain